MSFSEPDQRTIDDIITSRLVVNSSSSVVRNNEQVKIPDVDCYTWGDRNQLHMWTLQLKNKFESDASIYLTEEDRVRYMISRLRGRALEVVLRIVEGTFKFLIGGMNSLTINTVADALHLAQARREMKTGNQLCVISNFRDWSLAPCKDYMDRNVLLCKGSQYIAETAHKDLLLMTLGSKCNTSQFDMHEAGCQLIELEPHLDLQAFGDRLIQNYNETLKGSNTAGYKFRCEASLASLEQKWDHFLGTRLDGSRR